MVLYPTVPNLKDKKKKYEPPVPTRVGKKKKKTKGPDAASKLPLGNDRALPCCLSHSRETDCVGSLEGRMWTGNGCGSGPSSMAVFCLTPTCGILKVGIKALFGFND